MTEFLQQVVAGLASGSIYALLALAIVIIYRSTGVVNFAQGEMATFTTFIAWTLVDRGIGYWGAFALTLLIAFVGGIALERIVVHPVEGKPVINAIILTIWLFILLAGLYKLHDLTGANGEGIHGQIIAGSIAAAVAAWFAVRFLVRFFETRNLMPFAVYCFVVGGASIIRFA